jgi:hypothetical protein
VHRSLAGLAAVAAASALPASTAVASSGQPLGTLGTASHSPQATYKGYYDGHKDAYLITDVSSKTQASAMHINYSPPLKAIKGAPEQYFVTGRAAPGQLAIFGSEPGESSYNPLWEEVFVTFTPGATPVLVTSDTQIDQLEKAGKMTEKDAHIVLNAPITKVGKGG